MNWLRDLAAVFRPPTASVLALRELEDARRSLLGAHSAREYAAALVTYHTARVDRLNKTLSVGLSK